MYIDDRVEEVEADVVSKSVEELEQAALPILHIRYHRHIHIRLCHRYVFQQLRKYSLVARHRHQHFKSVHVTDVLVLVLALLHKVVVYAQQRLVHLFRYFKISLLLFGPIRTA